MAMPTAAEAAARWQTGMSAAGQKYVNGVNAVQVAPGVLAARAAPLWAANTAAAQPRFARNSAAVSLQEWQAAAAGKGAQRLASGAQAAQPKMEAALNKWFPIIASAVSALPPRGDIEANINRSASLARTLNKAKMQGN